MLMTICEDNFFLSIHIVNCFLIIQIVYVLLDFIKNQKLAYRGLKSMLRTHVVFMERCTPKDNFFILGVTCG